MVRFVSFVFFYHSPHWFAAVSFLPLQCSEFCQFRCFWHHRCWNSQVSFFCTLILFAKNMTCYLVIYNVNIWTNFSFPCLNINPVWKPNLVQSHLSAQVGLVLKPLKVVWTNSLEIPQTSFLQDSSNGHYGCWSHADKRWLVINILWFI